MNKDMIAVTDEILFELYRIEKRSLHIEPLLINGKYYLVNKRGVKDWFEIGLIVEIPKELLEDCSIDDIRELCSQEYTRKYKVNDMSEKGSSIDNDYSKYVKCQELMAHLTFTPKEMFVMNILLSNYLNTDYRKMPEISFKDLDYYRRKSSSYRNIVVPIETAESYRNIINSLCSKMIYLKTAPKFRKRPKKDYGVADRDFYQDLLTIYNPYLASSNNLSFKYSFGEFGEVIKLSKRWSNIVPNRCFQWSFNQAVNNVIACEIGRQIFIANYTFTPEFDLNVEYFFEHIEGETKKNMRYRRKNFNKNLIVILDSFVKDNKIEEYEILEDGFKYGKSNKVKIILNRIRFSI